MIAQGGAAMGYFAERYGTEAMDPEAARRHEVLEFARHEEASRLAYAKKSGEERGLKHGKELGEELASHRIARRMRELGMGDGDILAATGLTPEQVDAPLDPEE